MLLSHEWVRLVQHLTFLFHLSRCVCGRLEMKATNECGVGQPALLMASEVTRGTQQTWLNNRVGVTDVIDSFLPNIPFGGVWDLFYLPIMHIPVCVYVYNFRNLLGYNPGWQLIYTALCQIWLPVMNGIMANIERVVFSISFDVHWYWFNDNCYIHIARLHNNQGK